MKPSSPLFLVLACCAFFGCQKEPAPGAANPARDAKTPAKEGSAPASAPQQPAPVPVHVATAQTASVPLQVSAFGNAEPLSTVEVRAQVSGEVTAVSFTEGDEVAEGQELFRIDPRPFEVALAQAEANVSRMEAQLRQAEANLRQSEVQAQNARVELQRNQTLLEKELVTQEEFDQARTAAEAMLAASSATTAAVSAAQEDIRAATAQVDHARLQLEYCTIKSPMDGRTGSLLIHRGDIVSANATDPMVTIRQMKPIYVSFTLPERYLPQLRSSFDAGVRVLATIPNADSARIEGTLSFIDNNVDNATSTIRLKASFPNEDETLWPGQYVDLSVQLATLENAVTIPTPAIQTSQEGLYVFVVTPEGKAEMRTVKQGATYEGQSVVEGVQAGEVVITDGQLRVTPDGPVKVLNAEAPAEPAAP